MPPFPLSRNLRQEEGSLAILCWGLFTVCGNGVWLNAMRTIQVLFPIRVGGSKPILSVSSGGVLAFFAFAAEPRPGHRFQTSLRDRLKLGRGFRRFSVTSC